MFQIDNDTSSQNMPAPTAAGIPGFFVDGDPAKGIPATILPAEFMNMLMMEYINVVKSAGLKPSKADYTQLAQALPLLISKLATVDWSKVTNVPADLVHANTTPVFGGLELNSGTPYIDFHFGNDASDYNLRLINNADGNLALMNKAGTVLWNTKASVFDIGVPSLMRKGVTVLSQGGGMSELYNNADNTLIRFGINHTDTTYNICTFTDAGTYASSAISITRSNNRVVLSGGLEVSGAALVDSTLEVKGATVLDSTLEVKGAAVMDTTLEVRGATTLDSTLQVKGGAVIGTTFEVKGAVQLDSTLDVLGGATLRSNVNVGGALGCSASVTAANNVVAGVSVYAGMANMTSNVLHMQCNDAGNTGNVHLWLYNYDGTERALIYGDSSGALHFRANGQADSLVLASNGGAVFKATLTAAARVQGGDLLSQGNLYLGGGATVMQSDANISGSVWGGYLSTYLTNTYVTRTNLPGDLAVYASNCGAVGTYAYLRNNSGTNIDPGGLIAGSNLAYSDSDEHVTGTPAGTWRAMGWGTSANCSMYMRVS